MSSRPERPRISYFTTADNGHVCDSPPREAHPFHRSHHPRQEIRGSGVEGSAVCTVRHVMEKDKHYYVYIVASRTHVLYIGLTNNLKRRVEQHRNHAFPGFTDSYQCERLVWFESYRYVYHALNREKELKRWGGTRKSG